MRGSAENTTSNLRDEAYDRLGRDLSRMKGDISDLADRLSEAMKTFNGNARRETQKGYRRAREDLDNMLSDATERGSAAIEAAQSAASSIEEAIEETIQQRPIAALGLAASVGFLLGIAWRK